MNRRLKLSGQSLSGDNPNRRQCARDWALGLRGPPVEVCLRTIWTRVIIAIKTAWLGYGRNERCVVSRKQHSVSWYNVVDIGHFTRQNCVKLETLSALVLLLFTVSIPSVHTSSKGTYYTSWRCLLLVRLLLNNYKTNQAVGCFLMYILCNNRTICKTRQDKNRSNTTCSSCFRHICDKVLRMVWLGKPLDRL